MTAELYTGDHTKDDACSRGATTVLVLVVVVVQNSFYLNLESNQHVMSSLQIVGYLDIFKSKFLDSTHLDISHILKFNFWF